MSYNSNFRQLIGWNIGTKEGENLVGPAFLDSAGNLYVYTVGASFQKVNKDTHKLIKA